MTILIVCDSFKDGCSSRAACVAIASGLESAKPALDLIICPISDGGEGTVEILKYHLGGSLKSAKVSDPLFRQISANYLKLPNDIAIIEMAQASGLELLEKQERNPMNTTSFGTGELIKNAITEGCSNIILTVGGSATNDLGMGMANALGFQFKDRQDISITPIGASMQKVVNIELEDGIHIEDNHFTVVTDVSNPLHGPQGAAKIFAAQKGASPEDVELLDQGLFHLSSIIKRDLHKDISTLPGVGAAGGLGGGAVAFLNADISSGFEKISALIDLESKILNADLIITGEGHLDMQSKSGKAVNGITELANKHNKPITVFCGRNSLDLKEAQSMGIKDIIPISEVNSDFDLEVALVQTTQNLEDKARQWAKNNLKSEM